MFVGGLMAVVEVTVVPVGTEGPSLSDYVAGALEVLEENDVEYELTSTGTILEGDLEEVLEVAREMHESVFDEEVQRVVTTIRIDDRKDKELEIEGKKESVEESMER
mgnify:CR=1 FL=1